MEVYALHAQWCALGSGRQFNECASSATTAFPQEIPKIPVKLIDDAFEQALYEFARAAHASILFACYDEIENACDPDLVTPAVLKNWLENEATEAIRSGFHLTSNKITLNGQMYLEYGLLPFDRDTGGFMAKVGGWPSIIRIFQARFWKDQADLYGGGRWATIATEAMKLLGEIKRGDPRTVMCAVHDLLRLRHNTGFLFTKSSMGGMALSQQILERIMTNTLHREVDESPFAFYQIALKPQWCLH
jgi:hypothetical protein